MASSAGEDLQLGDLCGWSWRGNGEQRGKDLPALGWRHRRHYDMRATFITFAIEDGADPDVIETRVTHSRKARNVFDGYNRGCTGSGRARRSRSCGSRVDRKARRSRNRPRPAASRIRCHSLQSLQLAETREESGPPRGAAATARALPLYDWVDWSLQWRPLSQCRIDVR